jgi:hypothetical protein
MAIPPHRAPGDVGHINDHNDMSDTLNSHESRVDNVTDQVSTHLSGTDPHGDRAYADANKAALNHTHSWPVASVNGKTGTVVLSAADLSAIPTSLMGAPSGVATLDTGGKVPTAQLPAGSGGGGGGGFDPGWENVKDYGATGDGSTNDTAAIQAAINAAQSGTRKRPVYFPYGTYKMTSPITLATGLSLYGEVGHGKEFDRRVNLTNTSTDMFTWGGTGATDSSQRPADMHFQGITFSGSTSHDFITPSNQDASGAYPLDLTITWCGIKNFNTVFNAPALRLKLADCYINSCADTPLTIGGSDCHIVRNFIDTYVPGSHSGKAVVVLNVEESTFSQNYVTCAPAMGIKVNNHTTGLRITDNTINGLAQSSSHGGFTYPEGPGIYVSSGANGVSIIGNLIGNTCNDPWTSGAITYDGAITVVDAYDISIMGNTIYNTKSASAYHIRLRRNTGTVKRIKIVGNTYLNDSGDQTPRIAKAGTMSNNWIDEEITGGTGSSGTAVAGINSTVAVTNTTTEAVLCAYTIAASTALQGDTYRITIGGSSDIGTAGGTLTLRVRIGGTAGQEVAGLQWTLGTTALAGKPFHAVFDILVAANASSSTTLKGVAQGYNNIVTTGQSGANYNSAAANLTVDKDLIVAAKWSAADASHSVRCEIATIEKIR